MVFFVTGGSGFVGGRLIEILVAQGASVKALVRSEQSARVVGKLGAEPVSGDLSNLAALSSALNGVQCIFHVAGHITMFDTYENFNRVNVLGTENLLKAAQQAGVSTFIQVGAAAVVMHGHEPIYDADETLPLVFPDYAPYVSTKAKSERLVLAANSQSLRTAVVRPPAIWGKGDRTILPSAIKMAQSGPVPLFSGGDFEIDTCHVDNVCHGLILAAEKARGGETYFLSDDERTNLREFLLGLLETQNLKPRTASVPYSMAWFMSSLMETFWNITRRAGEPPLTRTMVRLVGRPFTISIAKARVQLDYKPVKTRAQGLAELRVK